MDIVELLVQEMEEWIVDSLVIVMRPFCNERERRGEGEGG
jgi:hypothetical protein